MQQINLKATRRATVFPDRAANRKRRLLTETLERVPHFRRHSILERDALHHAGAVTELRKKNLAAGAQVVEPAVDRHLVTNVVSELAD